MRYKILVLFLLFLQVTTFAEAGEFIEDVDIGANISFLSAYIWRAQTLVDSPVLQPAGYVSYKGFTFNFWSNWDVTDEDEFTEIDYTWDYSTSLGFLTLHEDGEFLDKINVTAGYTLYTFPNLDTDDISNEVFAGISLDTILNPSYTAYWDFDEGDGWYHEWGIGHSFDLEPITIDTGLAMGLNVDQWGFDTSLTALLFSLASTVPLNALTKIEVLKYITVQPIIAYSLPLDNQYDNELYGGVLVGIDF